MDESKVMYMGRMIPKEGFRAFVYGKDNRQKIVESWDEFLNHLATGDWFSSQKEADEKEELIEFADSILNEQNDAVIMDKIHERERNRRKASK